MSEKTVYEIHQTDLDYDGYDADNLNKYASRFHYYRDEPIDWSPMKKCIQQKLDNIDFWEINRLPWKIYPHEDWKEEDVLHLVFMLLAENLTFQIEKDLYVSTLEVISPIEKYLLLGLLMYGYRKADGVILHIQGYPFGTVRYPNLKVLHIFPQVGVERYIVDFKVGWVETHREMYDPKDLSTFNTPPRQAEKFVLVECDGHEFHEKTKEQARSDKERDRMLQYAGWKVIRFPGSVIEKDALECAKEVIDYLALTVDAEVYKDETDNSKIPF
jgi:very-short-patch-repair endonuclease